MEEEIIPEEKVISNELDQSNDLLNELMKMIPEKQRVKSYIIRKMKNILKFCQYLKKDHSIYVNNEITEAKIKGNNYRANLDDYVNSIFDNDYLIPIVNESKKLYHVKETEDFQLIGENLDDVDDPLIVKVNNEDDITSQINMREKYRKTRARLNYSYEHELNELYSSLEHYSNIGNNNTFETQLTKDIEVFNNELMMLNNNKYGITNVNHKLLGPVKYNVFDDKDIVKGDNISIKGFMRKPIQKQQIFKPNEHSLLDVINSTYSYLDLYKNLNIQETEIVNIQNNIGDIIRITNYKDTKSIEYSGYLENIDEDKYTLKPIPEPDQDPSTIENIEVVVDENSIIHNLNYNRFPLTYKENIYYSYLFTDKQTKMNKNTYKELLKNIIPSTNEVIYKISELFNSTKINDLDKELKYYNLKLDDITHELFNPLKETLFKNNSAKINDAIKSEARFKTFIKKPNPKQLSNFQFINNNSLKQFEMVYGPYPYFRTDIDSIEMRLKWLKSRPDHGELFFKSIVKKIQDKLDLDIDGFIRNLERSKDELTQAKNRLEEEIETEKNKLIAEKNICLDNYISKEYHSFDDLKKDNNRPIEIDKDKIIMGKPNNVPINSYALLHSTDGKKQLFKRIELNTGEHMWNLEGGVAIEHIINTNKDFCDQQFKNLNELNSAIGQLDTCRFSDIDNSCVSKTLELNIRELNSINKQIEDNQYYISNSDNMINFNTNLNAELEKYNTFLVLSNDQKKRIYIESEKSSIESREETIDPKYEILYLKIDLWLEKIANLPDDLKYELLNDLIKKYGRPASTRNEENDKNIYCKYGTKVICCKHNINLINMFKSKDNYDTLLKETIETYGIEDVGKYWCNNCGKEIFIGEYETSEGFKKSGARDITHAELETDEETSNYQDSDLVSLLKEHLTFDESHINETELIDIFKIVNVLLNIMGIKLTKDDELKIYTKSNALITTHIKKKDVWAMTYRGKPKVLDKNYENYVNMNTIFYTTCNLFILLQTSMPQYTINKQHSKCKTSLEGFPLDLDESNTNGIKYLACILEQLRNTDSIWKCLKKLKIDKILFDTLTKLYSDDLIKHQYSLKRTFIKNTIIEQEIEVNNNWTKFNPPINLFEINNASLNSINLATKPKNVTELSNYYSLKFISEIDQLVNDSPIENVLFSPAILQQSCCLNKLESNYNNLMIFYKQNTKLEQYLSNSNILEEFQQILPNSNITINKPPSEALETFANIMFPLDDDVDQETITSLFEYYISEGDFVGQKHIYNNDICILTGQTRSAIKQKIYRKDAYYELINNIFKQKLMENKVLNDNLNIIDTLKEIINSNPILNSNSYLSTFIDNLSQMTKPNDITNYWNDDFKAQLDVEKDELIELFSDYDQSKTLEIRTILSTFSNLQNIYTEELELYGEQHANDTFFESKINLLYKYIYSYLFDTISKIKHNKSDEEIVIPQSWKIEKSYISNLKSQTISDNELVNKYITSKHINNNSVMYTNIFTILKQSTRNLKNIFSENHIYDCSKITRYSKLTNENLALLLEFIFIIIVKQILNNTPIRTRRQTSTFDQEQTILSTDDIVVGDLEELEEIPSDEIVSNNKKETYSLIYDILNKIHNNTIYTDRYTQSKINEAIETKSDIEKENTLKFIEELDKESRHTIKTMIALGIDKWKDISKKTNKELYFDEKEPEDLDEVEQTEEETNELNHQMALAQYGENYSNEQFQELIDTQNRNAQEDRDALQEGDAMPDDDGDNYGMEDDYDGEF